MVLASLRVAGHVLHDMASVHVLHEYIQVWHCYCNLSSYNPVLHIQNVDVLSYIRPLVMLQLLQLVNALHVLQV